MVAKKKMVQSLEYLKRIIFDKIEKRKVYSQQK